MAILHVMYHQSRKTAIKNKERIEIKEVNCSTTCDNADCLTKITMRAAFLRFVKLGANLKA